MYESLKACKPDIHFNIVDKMMRIPQQILTLHHMENLTDMVLYDIANEECLSLAKAAYLVDNPDFNSLRGVCGYNNMCSRDKQKTFSEQACKSAYNSKIKQFSQHSMKAQNQNPVMAQNIQQLAEKLEMQNPIAHCWELRHNNFGIFLFEPITPLCCEWKNTLIEKLSHFLGFCAF